MLAATGTEAIAAALDLHLDTTRDIRGINSPGYLAAVKDAVPGASRRLLMAALQRYGRRTGTTVIDDE